MPVIGDGHHHRVDVAPVEDLAVVEVALALEFLFVLGDALLPDVAHGHHFARAGLFTDVGKYDAKTPAAIPQPDDPQVDAVVRAPRATAQSPAKAERCSSPACAFHEIPTIQSMSA